MLGLVMTKLVVTGRAVSNENDLLALRETTLKVPALFVVPPGLVSAGLNAVEVTLVCTAGKATGVIASFTADVYPRQSRRATTRANDCVTILIEKERE